MKHNNRLAINLQLNTFLNDRCEYVGYSDAIQNLTTQAEVQRRIEKVGNTFLREAYVISVEELTLMMFGRNLSASVNGNVCGHHVDASGRLHFYTHNGVYTITPDQDVLVLPPFGRMLIFFSDEEVLDLTLGRFITVSVIDDLLGGDQ